MKDKRKFKRRPIDAVMMYYADDYQNGDVERIHHLSTPFIVDLGLGGLQMVVDRHYRVGTLLHLYLSLTSTDIPLELKGKVVWEQDYESDRLHRMGIEFVDLNDLYSRNMIKESIE